MVLFRAALVAFSTLILLATSVTAQSDYRVRSGDVLSLEVIEDGSLNRSLLVLPDGSISVPLVGSLPARGQTLSQIAANIRNGLAPNFATDPNVFVGVSALAEVAPPVIAPAASNAPAEPIAPPTIAVYVIGEAVNPGKQEIAPGTTVLQFLAEMGGFTPFAATKRIQLRTSRSGEAQVFNINFNDIERGGAGAGLTTVMAEGDVIVVPQRRLFE